MAPFRPPVKAIDIYRDHPFASYINQPVFIDVSTYVAKTGQELQGSLLGQFPAEIRLKILLMACGDRLRPYHDKTDRDYSACAYRQLLATCKTFHNELKIEVLRNVQVLFLGLPSLDEFMRNPVNYGPLFKTHVKHIALELDFWDVPELIEVPGFGGMCQRQSMKKRPTFRGVPKYKEEFWRRLGGMQLEELTVYVGTTYSPEEYDTLYQKLSTALARCTFKPCAPREVRVFPRRSYGQTTYPGEGYCVVPLAAQPRLALAEITGNARTNVRPKGRKW